jgi:hypothetical protein
VIEPAGLVQSVEPSGRGAENFAHRPPARDGEMNLMPSHRAGHREFNQLNESCGFHISLPFKEVGDTPNVSREGYSPKTLISPENSFTEYQFFY